MDLRFSWLWRRRCGSSGLQRRVDLQADTNVDNGKRYACASLKRRHLPTSPRGVTTQRTQRQAYGIILITTPITTVNVKV